VSPRQGAAPAGSTDVPELPDTLAAVDTLQLQAQCTIDGVVVRDAALRASVASGAKLVDSRLIGTDLSESKLRSATLRECIVQRCDLSNGDWSHVQSSTVLFEDCRCVGLMLTEAELRETTLRRTRADYVNFRMATLTNVTFEDVQLHEADFYGARLTSVSFVRCELARADFSAVKLQNVDLRGSSLDDLRGVSGLRGATVDQPQLISLAPALAAESGIAVEQ
jgi:uncharacterized protein YjbI with pentapeptide repeats